MATSLQTWKPKDDFEDRLKRLLDLDASGEFKTARIGFNVALRNVILDEKNRLRIMLTIPFILSAKREIEYKTAMNALERSDIEAYIKTKMSVMINHWLAENQKNFAHPEIIDIDFSQQKIFIELGSPIDGKPLLKEFFSVLKVKESDIIKDFFKNLFTIRIKNGKEINSEGNCVVNQKPASPYHYWTEI